MSAKSASMKLVRTLISRPYTRYRTVTDGAPPVCTRQRFLAVFSTGAILSAGACLDVFDVPRELAHEVRPGRPHRHLELDLRPPARGHRGLDLDVMRLRCGETQRVAKGLWRGGSLPRLRSGFGRNGHGEDQQWKAEDGTQGHHAHFILRPISTACYDLTPYSVIVSAVLRTDLAEPAATVTRSSYLPGGMAAEGSLLV